MGGNKKSPIDAETILITRDHLGQIIDIMATVAGRLRYSIPDQHPSESKNDEPTSDRSQKN